ncbi:hypothetical protein [Oceanithermus sp.]|uniref:hypothetical protein n=1 Tax=Oceanithermus sp. TaxID=2268145 RepID=UPI00257962AE|nr:hypothetical protein [Oceanithermus sp.]
MNRKPHPTLQTRVLRMVHAFEGGHLAGDFDGQVLSWGPLQWNLGQGTLGPVLARIVELEPEQAARIMGEEFVEAARRGNAALVGFARARILDRRGRPTWEWRNAFHRLEELPGTQQAFREAAQPYLDRGRRLVEALEFTTERAYALGVDIAVQNGAPRRDHIRRYRRRLGAGTRYPMEWQRLKLLAQVVADSANPRWREDVLSRKLTIAVGRGTVHGRRYELERDFGISYWRKWWEDPDRPSA